MLISQQISTTHTVRKYHHFQKDNLFYMFYIVSSCCLCEYEPCNKSNSLDHIRRKCGTMIKQYQSLRHLWSKYSITANSRCYILANITDTTVEVVWFSVPTFFYKFKWFYSYCRERYHHKVCMAPSNFYVYQATI